MSARNNLHRREATRFSREGRSVFVTLNVDRRAYEYARSWAVFHAPSDPEGTAECQLEGLIFRASLSGMCEDGWEAPAEIEALYRHAGNPVAVVSEPVEVTYSFESAAYGDFGLTGEADLPPPDMSVLLAKTLLAHALETAATDLRAGSSSHIFDEDEDIPF